MNVSIYAGHDNGRPFVQVLFADDTNALTTVVKLDTDVAREMAASLTEMSIIAEEAVTNE
jgi:hypothetical protein